MMDPIIVNRIFSMYIIFNRKSQVVGAYKSGDVVSKTFRVLA